MACYIYIYIFLILTDELLIAELFFIMNETFPTTELNNLSNLLLFWDNKTFSRNESNDVGNCSSCLNELCIPETDYNIYRSWVSVDTFEMVLITLNIFVFLAGIIGNALVSLM